MALLTLRDIKLSFGADPLFNGVSLQIYAGERICILGRNGEGKSTLLKVIEGVQPADEGERQLQDGVKIARLQQEVPHDLEASVFSVVAQGLGELGILLEKYAESLASLETDSSEENLTRFNQIQQDLENNNAWELQQKVEKILSQMSLDGDVNFESLSGGMKRRVLLARALIQEPDILLLDEPTNHLDIAAINWLEETVSQLTCSLVFITHDRAFLQKIARRIVELDRGQLLNWDCDYSKYLERKESDLAAEETAQAEQDKKLAQEEAWLRRGVKARRARNEGRVRALEKLRLERQARRSRQGTSQLQVNISQLSGKKVIEVENLTFNWPDKPIVNNFTTLIARGDKVGLVGPNGCGKSTFIKLLLGQLEPQEGRVELGSNLQVAYFDQHRAQLKEEYSLIDNITNGSETLEVNGQQRHVIGYLGDFLFSPDRMRQPVKALSGGERNRLLLAKLFAQPSNFLVLDEPTNDLDLETLEVLEEMLANYSGTVLIVSHDREFLNNVVTSVLAFDAPGRLNEYVGGYDDYLAQRPENIQVANKSKPKETKQEKAAPAVQETPKPQRKKLSYKDQREYDSMEQTIEELEQKLEALSEQATEPDFYQQDQELVQQVLADLSKVEADLETTFARWEELEEMQA